LKSTAKIGLIGPKALRFQIRYGAEQRKVHRAHDDLLPGIEEKKTGKRSFISTLTRETIKNIVVRYNPAWIQSDIEKNSLAAMEDDGVPEK